MNKTPSGKIRVLIVDDHVTVREGLAAMLSRDAGIAVVGEAENGRVAIEKAGKLQPDVILMDLRMPEVDGIEAMLKIKAGNPDTKFIVLTTYDNDEYIFKGIEAGARAYLLKDSPKEDLFRAIKVVSQGGSLIEPAVAGKVLDRFVELSHQSTTGILSEREAEVLQLLAKGTGNKLIASTLGISESTVKSHIQSLFNKLEVNDRTEAVTQAIKKGLLHI